MIYQGGGRGMFGMPGGGYGMGGGYGFGGSGFQGYGGSRMGAPMGAMGGGQSVDWNSQGGGMRYDGGMDGTQQQGAAWRGGPQMSGEFQTQARGYDQPMNGGGYQYQPPMQQRGGMFAKPQGFDPYNPQPQGAALARFAEQNMAQFGNYGQQPQMQASPAMGDSVNFSGQMPVNRYQPPAPQQPQLPGAPGPQQQSFDQYAATLQGSGMTSGQMQDAYQKSIQPTAGQPFTNIGPGGTQNPFPGTAQPFPSQWGQQTFGFDPRAMAGKQVTGDMGWYYGRDAIGRNINNQGNAVPSFGAPANGPGRSRPWFA